MKTYLPKASEDLRTWHLIDADVRCDEGVSHGLDVIHGVGDMYFNGSKVPLYEFGS